MTAVDASTSPAAAKGLQERAGGPSDVSQSIRLCDNDIKAVESGLGEVVAGQR
jgi:hypothetical protein